MRNDNLILGYCDRVSSSIFINCDHLNEVQIEKSDRLKCLSQEAIKDVYLNEKVVDIYPSFPSNPMTQKF
jgi:hypothetical protein